MNKAKNPSSRPPCRGTDRPGATFRTRSRWQALAARAARSSASRNPALATGSVDEQGQNIRRKFDHNNRVIERTDSLGRTTRYQYDTSGNVTRMVDALGRITDTTYDGRWNQAATITRYNDPTPFGTANPQTRSMTYDGQKGALLTSTDPLTRTTTNTYTAQSLLATLTDPLSRTSRFNYNAAGDLVKVTDPLGNEAQTGYDGAGRATSSTNPLGYTSTTQYNAVDQVTQTTNPLNQTERQSFDNASRLTAVTNAANVVVESYAYDAADRLTTKTDALAKTTAYQYDSSNRVTQMTDRNGRVTRYVYDAKGRVSRIELPDGAVQTRDYDSVGRLTRIDETGGSGGSGSGGNSSIASTETYAYDTVDRLTQKITTANGNTDTTAYQYDALDRITRRTIQSGTINNADVTDYAWDNANQLISISFKLPGQADRVTAYTYDAAGQMTSKTLPGTNGNPGIRTTYSFDSAGRVTQIEWRNPPYAIADQIDAVSYTYDANGNRLTKTFSGTGPNAFPTASVQETPFSATYNAANRMTADLCTPRCAAEGGRVGRS